MVHQHKGRGQAQRAGQFPVAPEHLAFDLVGPRRHVARLFQQRHAGFCRLVATSLAIK
jgi:hypothetical protein